MKTRQTNNKQQESGDLLPADIVSVRVRCDEHDLRNRKVGSPGRDIAALNRHKYGVAGRGLHRIISEQMAEENVRIREGFITDAGYRTSPRLWRSR